MPEVLAQTPTEEVGVPPRITSRSLETRVLLAVTAAVMIICLALLFIFNPAQHSFYPRCTFYQLTGWQCPGCGGLRALHQLLHGHLLTALQLNALVVLGMPLVAWGAWRELAREGMKLRPRIVWLAGAALLGFGVVRNLPGFGWLSP